MECYNHQVHITSEGNENKRNHFRDDKFYFTYMIRNNIFLLNKKSSDKVSYVLVWNSTDLVNIYDFLK